MTIKGENLKHAADPGRRPNQPGVYILYLHGRMMKVGSAKIGIQKRMQQYYGLNPHCGLNQHIDTSTRDGITVDYQLCQPSECAELESKLFDKYGAFMSLPWAVRRPREVTDTVRLLL